MENQIRQVKLFAKADAEYGHAEGLGLEVKEAPNSLCRWNYRLTSFFLNLNKPQTIFLYAMIIKAKAAVFIIATVILVLKVILLVVEKLNYLIFLGILFLIFVGANTAYRSIDRRRKINP